MLIADGDETRGGHPVTHFRVTEPEPAMGMSFAQLFHLMGCEIDNHHKPARPQHAGGLAHRNRRIVKEMQNLVNRNSVKGFRRQGQLEKISLTHAAMVEPRPLQIRARHAQHLATLIDAEPALDPRGHQFQDPAGAGADIEKIVDSNLVESA